MKKEIKFECQCGCTQIEQISNANLISNKISNIKLYDDNISKFGNDNRYADCETAPTELINTVVSHFQCYDCGMVIGDCILNLNELAKYLEK